jgi:hypothetical protein
LEGPNWDWRLVWSTILGPWEWRNVTMNREDWLKLLKKTRVHTGLSSQWWWRWCVVQEMTWHFRIILQFSTIWERSIRFLGMWFLPLFYTQ